jgi:hypothetical protein
MFLVIIKIPPMKINKTLLIVSLSIWCLTLLGNIAHAFGEYVGEAIMNNYFQ